jgi:hypothetical protein
MTAKCEKCGGKLGALEEDICSNCQRHPYHRRYDPRCAMCVFERLKAWRTAARILVVRAQVRINLKRASSTAPKRTR